MTTVLVPAAQSLPLPPLSWNLGADLRELTGQHFMVNALLAGTVVAVLGGAVGWVMVLRRQSFAGHTLAVVSFPGAAAALWLGIGVSAGYFGATITAALVIAAVPRPVGARSQIREGAVIGTVQAFALACGVLFVSLYGGFLDSATSLLFGTFLGISNTQVATLAAVTAAVLAALAGMARPLTFASVDPDVAAARGVPVRALDAVFLVVLGATAAGVSQITGALLVFALLVMPAAAAQQLTARPGLGAGLSVAVAVVVTWGALAAAYFSTVPVGFLVTTLGFAAYLAAVAGRRLALRTGRSRLAPATAAPVA